MKFNRDRLIDALNIFALFGLALAQPLFNLLSQNAEFFVARHSKPGDMIFMIALLSLFCPAIFVAAGETIGILGHRIRRGYYFIVVAILTACIALPIFKKLFEISGAAVVGAASGFGLLLAILYTRFREFRTNFVFLSPAILVFPLMFLFSSGIYEIVFPDEPASAIKVTVKNPAPVVFVVFDELPVTSLMNEDHLIDPVRYPNFAALAEDSYWLRNATTISSNTLISLPSMLSGRYPVSGDLLPISPHHREQLFTLLGGSYEMKVFEVVTELCPAHLCSEVIEHTEPIERLQSLLSDLIIVYLHVLLPRDFSSGIPDVTSTWKDFGKEIEPVPDPTPHPDSEPNLETLDRLSAWKTLWGRINWRDRVAIFQRLVDSIEADDTRTLFFLHVMLPHSTWHYLPSGKSHSLRKDRGIRGNQLNEEGEETQLWTDDHWAITQMLQRHILQVGFTDTLLGYLVARLKSVDLYDRSLIIITSDHGISFQSGTKRKSISDKNYYDIMAIPLLIKAPYQRQGVISDRNVETVDILPTIADILKIELPFQVDGQSGLKFEQPEKNSKATYSSSAKRYEFEPNMDAKYQTLERLINLFGSDSNDTLYSIGTYNGLVGRSITVEEVDKQSGMEVILEHADAYTNLNLDGPFIPANVTGQVVTNRPGDEPVNLAVAVNGTIRAVTETYAQNGETKFSALVPEESFSKGSNEVRVYVAQGTSISDLSRIKQTDK